MNFVVLANDSVFEMIRQEGPTHHWVQVENAESFADHADADAFFDLMPGAIHHEHPVVNNPLFLHSVTDVLPATKKAIRINAWNGFLQNNSWEVAGPVGEKERLVLTALNKKVIECGNEPGFIAARVIAMIINEAYFAKEENVSTEAEIDTAMKLGTNYPYGPFEWAQRIGLQNIHDLLEKLSAADSRYTPARLLTQTVTC